MHFRGRSAGLLKWAEDYDMSKMEQIEFQLAAAASEAPRGAAVSGTEAIWLHGRHWGRRQRIVWWFEALDCTATVV
jgi:hypothetical protein